MIVSLISCEITQLIRPGNFKTRCNNKRVATGFKLF